MYLTARWRHAGRAFAQRALLRAAPETEDERTAHVNGPIAQALMKVAPDLLASEPVIQPVDVIAAK
jgi:hypothetical protein